MKKSVFFAAIAAAAFLTACSSTSGSGILFGGTETGRWEFTGSHAVENGILSLQGDGAMAVLKDAKYRDFELDVELRTVSQGKGFVAFHSDKSAGKGYRIAINNDRRDPVWWKMSGSLLSVRNLTKSFVRDEDWYRMTVRVEGHAVTVAINGSPVVEYIEPAAPYRVAPNEGALLSDGTFVLASEGGGEIQFRHIEVNVIQADKALVQAQPAEAGDEQTDEIIRLHQEDFPVLDYHVHLKGGLTEDEAAQMSRKLGINYAMAPNCGIGFPITNDEEVLAYLDRMRSQPFILGMQAEGREWVTTFSQAVRDEFDYVFTDALTFNDDKGRRTRLWIPNETWIDDEQAYMDVIVDRICKVLTEPADIYVNPCFLPEPMNLRYDAFWTEERMNKFIDAMAKSGEALEINARYKIPNRTIIMKAKAAGVKFTFGTNNGLRDLGKLEYCIQMKKECGITAEDMYKPSIKL
ncbi:MAG: DUF1080 domain-containing protein [Tannerella sp.]|jgi:hypothetical protein|nr:DUF1080 domain-containing protein [Tannerella sp.]